MWRRILLVFAVVQASDCPCDDGVACTLDVCQNGTCEYTADHTSCVDGWPCTDDFCNLTSGCENVPKHTMCGDQYDCTIDRCSIGLGADVRGCTNDFNHTFCDDNASCSSNQCSPYTSVESSGCVNKYDDNACNDDEHCTIDTCKPWNTTKSSGCTNTWSCSESPDCILYLEQDEQGELIKPWEPCVMGRTFYACLRVQVVLSTRTMAKPPTYDPLSACNPSPCLGKKSSCEVVNTTHFVCQCSEDQSGTRCEKTRLREDAKTVIFYTACFAGGSLGVIALFLTCKHEKKESRRKIKKLIF